VHCEGVKVWPFLCGPFYLVLFADNMIRGQMSRLLFYVTQLLPGNTYKSLTLFTKSGSAGIFKYAVIAEACE